jgi:membrane-bound acyltransferase YfiQ involved in biofilm formation
MATSNSNFGIYLVGFILLIAGVAYGAYLAGIPPVWIGVVVLVLAGIGIMSAVKKTQRPARPRDDGGEAPPPRRY